jgi:hypothetical protein
MEPKTLPAALVTALSLAAQGCVATACLSVLKPPDSGELAHTGEPSTGPCLSVVPPHTGGSGVGPCLAPPYHTGEPSSDSGSGGAPTTGSGASGSGAARLDPAEVLGRLPADVRARLGR